MLDLFNKLKLIFKTYYHNCGKSGDYIIEFDAFNVLLVLSEKRNAMLFQGCGDDREEDKQWVEDMQNRLIELMEALRTLLNLNFYMERCGFFMYNQNVNMNIENKTDVLGYLCHFAPDDFTCSVKFLFDGNPFLCFGMIDITAEHITELKKRLADYQFVGSQINTSIKLRIDFY